MTTYTKEDLQLLKEAFQTIKGKALTCSELLEYGVCYNLQETLSPNPLFLRAYDIVPDLAECWPQAVVPYGCDKVCGYFVPDMKGFGQWEGPNLEMRLDLLDYLIAKCDALIAEQE